MVQSGGHKWWVATERLAEFQALHAQSTACPDPSTVFKARPPEPETALVEILRSRLSGLGPVALATLCKDLALPDSRVEAGLLALQSEGYALVMDNGRVNGAQGKTWCERRLLARIHRYSRERRRRTARPVAPAAFMRFLLSWHGFDEPAGELEQSLAQLEGWAAPVAAWESGLLAHRCADYSPQRLDEQFLSGYLTWFRPASAGQGGSSLVAASPIAFVPRANLDAWRTESSSAATPPGGVGRTHPGVCCRSTARCSRRISAGKPGSCRFKWSRASRNWWLAAWSLQTRFHRCAG